MEEIKKIEKQMMELSEKLFALRKKSKPVEVKNYNLETLEGEVSLLSLFGDKKKLMVIHNMGQACRYCTTWADGFNGFLPHLEDQFSVVLVSKDAPHVQKVFANSRGWRFRMASHGGGKYIQEQNVDSSHPNCPGLVCYERKDDAIYKMNSSIFGPGDQFCSLWHMMSLAGVGEDDWTPQYSYWRRPKEMDDGGKKSFNLIVKNKTVMLLP